MNPTKEEIEKAKAEFKKNGGKIKTEPEEFQKKHILKPKGGWGGGSPCPGTTHKIAKK